MKYTISLFFLIVFATMQAQNTTPPKKAQGDVRTRATERPADPFQSSIAVSDSGVQRLMLWIDEFEAQLNAETPGKGAVTVHTANLNLSKSNINKTKGNVKNVANALDKLKRNETAKRGNALTDLNKAVAELEAPMLELYNSILNLGESYAGKAAELKTRHDTVKNSISNIR